MAAVTTERERMQELLALVLEMAAEAEREEWPLGAVQDLAEMGVMVQRRLRAIGAVRPTRWAADSTPCPRCGEQEPTSATYEDFDGPESGLVWQGARCLGCGARWAESYFLQGAWVEETEEGKSRFIRVADDSLLDAALDVLANVEGSTTALGEVVATIMGMPAYVAEWRQRGGR